MDDGNDQVDELTLEPPTPVRSGRRRTLWATLAAVAVAAGALVVISAGDDDTPSAGLPVALGSSVADREASAGVADAMLAWTTYVPGDDLPTLGGEATAYRLRTEIDEDTISPVADALGVEGELVHDGPGWSVSGSTGTLEGYEGGGGGWWYSSTGGGSASGSGSSSGSAGIDSCVETSDDAVTDCTEPTATLCGPGTDCVLPTTTTTFGCGLESDPACTDEVPPPADLPSEDEARAIALDLLASTGVDVDGARVTVEGPYDAWFVSVEPLLEGVPSGLAANVSVGPGEVTSAFGYLADPEPIGRFPVLDTRAAIERANATSGTAGTPAPGRAGDTAVASDAGTPLTTTSVELADPATTIPPCKVQADGREICEQPSSADGCVNDPESAPPTTIPCDLPKCPQAVAPADEPIEAPETIDCVPPIADPGVVVPPVPTPAEVVLVDAEPSLMVLGAIDGSTDVYLVPAYRFTDADGGRVDLPAVADSALTTPPTTGTSAVDPGTPATDPPVTPCEVLVEGDASGTTHTVQPNPDCVIPEPQPLAEGEEPALGVGYYVDIDVECGGGTFPLGGRVWITDVQEVAGWADPGERHEGGIFTLDAPDHGTFVGDADGQLVAEFRPLGAAEDIFCAPAPRP